MSLERRPSLPRYVLEVGRSLIPIERIPLSRLRKERKRAAARGKQEVVKFSRDGVVFFAATLPQGYKLPDNEPIGDVLKTMQQPKV